MMFSKLNARSELVPIAHLADTPGKVNMQTVPLVRLGRTQQQWHIKNLSKWLCPKKLYSYQYWESTPGLWCLCLWRFFLPSVFIHFGPWPSRCNRSENTRLLENDSTDAISFNSAISACEKRLVEFGEHRDCESLVWGPEDLDLERLLCRLQNTFIFENLPFVWLADVFGLSQLPSFGCCKVIWVPEPYQDEMAIPFRLFSRCYCYHSKYNWRGRVRNMSTWSIRLLFVDLLHCTYIVHLYHFLSTWSSMKYNGMISQNSLIAHVGPSGMTASGIWWSILGCLVLQLILRVYSKICGSQSHWAHARPILLLISFRFVCRICILRGPSSSSMLHGHIPKSSIISSI